MEYFIIFIAILILVFQILFFAKFFGLCYNIEEIKELLKTSREPVIPFAKENYDVEPDGTPIEIGNMVLKRIDGTKMEVQRINSGMYLCVDPQTGQYIGLFSANELAKIK